MKYEIHFELQDGSKDSVIVSGSSLVEVRAEASRAVQSRNAKYLWSQPVGSQFED